MKLVRAGALAAALTAVTVTAAAAQPVIGFRAGVGMSKPSTESTVFEARDKSWLTVFIGGGFIRFGAGNIALQPELMYVTRGVKFEDGTLDIEEKTSVDYLEIPILLFLGLGTGAATPYIVVGPTLSFEVKCLVDDGGDEDQDCDDTVGPLSERKKFDVGPMFGAGLAFPAGPGSLIVDGRYYLGLMNIIDDDTDASFKHRTLAFTAGYQIPLGVR